MFELLSAGTMTTLTLELIKDIIRRYILKDMEFDFSMLFYKLMIPFLTLFWSIMLGVLGFTTPVAYDIKMIVHWAVSILVSLLLYEYGIKPMKAYEKLRVEEKEMMAELLAEDEED